MRNWISSIWSFPFWRSPWLHAIFTAACLAIPVGALTAVTLRGGYSHLLLLLLIAGGGCQMMLGIMLISGVWWAWRRSPLALRIIRYSTAAFVLLALQALISLPMGWAIAESDQNQVKAYCEQLIPLLEAHKIAHGQYPDTLNQLDGAPPPPAAANDEVLYYPADDGYHFMVIDDRHIFGWWRLQHDQQEWQHIVD